MTLRDTLNPLNLALALALVAATVAGFLLVPAGTSLPVHWGITGEADRFLPRDLALLLPPGIAVLTVALLTSLGRFFGPAQANAARHAMAAVVPALLGLFVVIQTGTVMIGMGMAVDMVRIVVLGVGVLLVVLGNVMPKTQPNGLAGIRYPWTLRDPVVWQATNRLGGLLMLLGGLVMILAALLTGDSVTLLLVTAAAVLVPLVVTTIYSLAIARRGA